MDTLIGVYDWERTSPTMLLLDVTMNADLSRAMTSDDVADTIDYAKVAECIVATGKQSAFALLEAFGHAVMKDVCRQFPVKDITLKITKPGILPNAQAVAVELHRDNV